MHVEQPCGTTRGTSHSASVSVVHLIIRSCDLFLPDVNMSRSVISSTNGCA
jgi:hypothetical protein